MSNEAPDEVECDSALLAKTMLAYPKAYKKAKSDSQGHGEKKAKKQKSNFKGSSMVQLAR